MIPTPTEKPFPHARLNEGSWPPEDASPGELDASWWTSFKYTKDYAPPALGAAVTFVDGYKPALDVYLGPWHLQVGWFAQ
jgi:hypothetical protein